MKEQTTFMTRFEQYYESMRLQYFRATGTFDHLIPSVETKILEQNQVLVSKLRKEAADAEQELIMRRTRLVEVESNMEQGLFTNRRGWEHFMTTTLKRPVHFIPRDRTRYVPLAPVGRGDLLGSEQAGSSSGYRDGSSIGKAGDLRTVLGSRRSETVGRRRSRSRSRGRSRKRVAPEGSDHTQKRRRSLTPFTVNRPEKEPRLILDSAEHLSCGKFVSSKGKGKGKGKSTQARLLTQDEVEERNVVFQMDVDNVEMIDRLLGYEDSD